MSSTNRQRVAEQRREKAAEQRRQETRRVRTRRIVIAAVVALALAIATVIVIGVQRSSPPSATAPTAASTSVGTTGGQIIPAPVTGAPTTQQATPMVADTSGITGVLAWDTTVLEHTHVTGPVTYTIVPPVGGPHSAIWMNAGIYTQPIPSERAVHNLEHGAVWITYDPTLPTSEVAQLTAFVTQQSMISESSGNANRYIDLSPWGGTALPSPIVLSSWGHQLQVTSATDPRMQQFIDTFRNSATYSPEYGAPVDGVPVDTGGRPASAGSAQANPSGSVSG